MKQSREFALMALMGGICAALIAVGGASDVSSIVRVIVWGLLAPAAFAQVVAIRNYRRFAKRYHAQAQEQFEQRLRNQAAERRRSHGE